MPHFHSPAATKLRVENVHCEEERPEIGGEVPEKQPGLEKQRSKGRQGVRNHTTKNVSSV